ncbi:MAG: hypothetical protein P8J47_06750 [Bacteroidales bacterium]|nr:hypothetical protein [Bacteroidales bacterium]
MNNIRLVIISMTILLTNISLVAQDEEKLAKASQNPVGDLISIPFQNNTMFNIGPYDRSLNTLNIQPVYPINLSEKWNIITRTIIPVVSKPDFSMETGGNTGLGDINITAFLSPSSPGKIIWGLGPAILLPTGSKDIGGGKWAAGPSVVALTMQGPWVVGVLVNNIWSFGGDSDRSDINTMLLQYFINYNMKKGWYITSSPIITSDWEALDGQQWIVPFGAGVGKIVKIGKLPLNINTQAFYNAVKPDIGPDWSFRFQLQLMFPK